MTVVSHLVQGTIVRAPGLRAYRLRVAGEGDPGRAAYISAQMIRLTITSAAFEAIADTIPQSVSMEAQRAPNGGYFIWLDPRSRPASGHARPYSDVILRLAKA